MSQELRAMDQTISAIFASAQHLEERPSGEPVPFLDVSLLRKAQRDLMQLLPRPDISPHERVVAYFVIQFINDVFYNLTGDIPVDDDVGETQVRFFKEVAGALGELADCLDQGAYDSCISVGGC